MRLTRCSPRSKSRWLHERVRPAVPAGVEPARCSRFGRRGDGDRTCSRPFGRSGRGHVRRGVLGASAADPQAFAAAWAAERGIIPTTPDREPRRRKPLVLVAFTAAAALTLIVAAVLLITGEPRIGLATTNRHSISPTLSGPMPRVARHVSAANASAPVEWILLAGAAIALAFAAWLWMTWSRSESIIRRAAH